MGILRKIFGKEQKESLKPIRDGREAEKAVPSREDIDRFVAAAEEGDIAAVRDMIGKGINPNALDQHGWPAITLASRDGNKDVVELLLANGASPDLPSRTTRETALMRAAANGHIQIADLLLKSGAHVNATDNSGFTALIKAAYAGMKDMVQLLISRGSDVRAKAPYYGDAWESAATQGHVEILEILRQAGAEGEKSQDEVLVLAAARGDQETVKRLLNSGIGPNTRVYRGLTALINSAQNGRGEIVDLLLSCGAAVNMADDNGNTPLIKAVQNGHTATAKRLIQAGADVHAQDIAGFSALLLAVYEGNQDIVRLLLEGGANPNSFEPLSAKTVLTIAREKGRHDVADILTKWSARDALASPAPREIKITDLGD